MFLGLVTVVLVTIRYLFLPYRLTLVAAFRLLQADKNILHKLLSMLLMVAYPKQSYMPPPPLRSKWDLDATLSLRKGLVAKQHPRNPLYMLACEYTLLCFGTDGVFYLVAFTVSVVFGEFGC